MDIPQEMLTNRAYYSSSVAFNRQMPGFSTHGFADADKPDLIPNAIQVLPDGSVECRFYAPTAKTVSVGPVHESQVTLTKGEGGIWSGSLRFKFPGIKKIIWRVDGVEVLNPYAPVAYGYGHPVNFIDVPCQEHAFLMIKDVPHGSIVRDIFKSSVTGEYESCLVYLPPSYYENSEQRFPVLYLQHGGHCNENCWVYDGKTNFMMDNLIAEGKAVPFIIVMNNGMVQIKGDDGVWGTDFDRLQDLIIDDCIPFIEKRYRTYTDAWNRAYAGLSMGSLQGGRFFMERRDIIASAGLFSGYKFPTHNNIFKGRSQDYLKVMVDADAFNKTVRLFFLAVGQHEPSLEKVEEESRECTAKGIKHIYRSYPGEHEWHVWRAAAHDFFQLVFK